MAIKSMNGHFKMTNIVVWLFLLLLASTSEAFAPQQWSNSATSISPSASRKRHDPKRGANGILLRASTPSMTGSSSSVWQPCTQPRPHYDCVISGGGPAGLLAAIMLTQHFGPEYSIAVCERRPSVLPSSRDPEVWMNDRFYLLGLGHRGQSALKELGVLDAVRNASVVMQGRRSWPSGAKDVAESSVIPANKTTPSLVLARDRLVGALHEHLVEEYIMKNKDENGGVANIDLFYGFEVTPVNFFGKEQEENENVVTVRITSCEETASADDNVVASHESSPSCSLNDLSLITASMLIGADGSARTVANAMQEQDERRFQQLNIFQKLQRRNRPFRVKRYEDDNPRVYKSIALKLPADWTPFTLNHSMRSNKDPVTGHTIVLEALPNDDRGSMVALLLMDPADPLAQPNVNPAVLREYMDREFAPFSKLLTDDVIQRVAKKPASALPAFRYVGPRLNMGQRTVLLGDAAHTVKPYFGLGANTALEDVHFLKQVLEECKVDAANEPPSSVIPRAVPLFSQRRAGDAKALVKISRDMDRPGKIMMMLNFVGPLILDSIFHKLAPRIFSPNMFGMFQLPNVSFVEIRRRKRLDRVKQAVCIFAAGFGLAAAAKALVNTLARATGKSSAVISAGMLAVAVVGGFLNKMQQVRKAKASSASG